MGGEKGDGGGERRGRWAVYDEVCVSDGVNMIDKELFRMRMFNKMMWSSRLPSFSIPLSFPQLLLYEPEAETVHQY